MAIYNLALMMGRMKWKRSFEITNNLLPRYISDIYVVMKKPGSQVSQEKPNVIAIILGIYLQSCVYDRAFLRE